MLLKKLKVNLNKKKSCLKFYFNRVNHYKKILNKKLITWKKKAIYFINKYN